MRGILFVLAAILLAGCMTFEAPAQQQEVVTEQDCPGCYADETGETAEEETTETVEETNETEETEEPLNETIEANESEIAEPLEYPETGCEGSAEYDIYTAHYVISGGDMYNDSCVTSEVVKKYYCLDDIMKTINEECPPGYVCKFGACEKYVGTCDDSDGNDLLVKGRVTMSEAPFSSSIETDECYDEGMVKEWLCNDTKGYYELIECGSGKKCENGRCVKSTCTETDGGDNPLIAGEAQEEGKEDMEDLCVSEYRLREYYCYGDRVTSKTYNCAEECKSRACVPELD